MGGLGAALALAKKGFKNISVYETASDLGFVGAGIQCPPNVGRILSSLGCWDAIEREATSINGASIRSRSQWLELTRGLDDVLTHENRRRNRRRTDARRHA